MTRVARLSKAGKRVFCGSLIDGRPTCQGILGAIWELPAAHRPGKTRILRFADESWVQDEDGLCRQTTRAALHPRRHPGLRRGRNDAMNGTARNSQILGGPRYLPAPARCPVCGNDSLLDPAALDIDWLPGQPSP